MTNIRREEKKRSYCVNVYLCVSLDYAKIKNKIKYSRGKFKLYIIEISKMSDLSKIKDKGYDGNLDKLYILSDPKIDKFFRKKPSLWQKAVKFYSEDTCLECLNTTLR